MWRWLRRFLKSGYACESLDPMKTIRGRVLFLTTALLSLLLVVAAWWFLPGRRSEVRLAAVTMEPVPHEPERADVGPIYLQTDPRWADDAIGGSRESLKRVGCTVCSVSMALAHHGIDLDPGELNRRLKEVDGYTLRGWLKWDAVRQVTDGRVRVELPPNPTHDTIDDALAAGDPVIVKVILQSGIQHRVLVVGREGNEYLMKDPLGDGRNLQPLSTIGSEIHAVRIVSKR